jgi:TctA family transporter
MAKDSLPTKHPNSIDNHKDMAAKPTTEEDRTPTPTQEEKNEDIVRKGLIQYKLFEGIVTLVSQHGLLQTVVAVLAIPCIIVSYLFPEIMKDTVIGLISLKNDRFWYLILILCGLYLVRMILSAVSMNNVAKK